MRTTRGSHEAPGGPHVPSDSAHRPSAPVVSTTGSPSGDIFGTWIEALSPRTRSSFVQLLKEVVEDSPFADIPGTNRERLVNVASSIYHKHGEQYRSRKGKLRIAEFYGIASRSPEGAGMNYLQMAHLAQCLYNAQEADIMQEEEEREWKEREWEMRQKRAKEEEEERAREMSHVWEVEDRLSPDEAMVEDKSPLKEARPEKTFADAQTQHDGLGGSPSSIAADILPRLTVDGVLPLDTFQSIFTLYWSKLSIEDQRKIQIAPVLSTGPGHMSVV